MNTALLKDFIYLVPEAYVLCLGILILGFDLFIPERFRRRYIINLSVWGLLLSLVLLVYAPAKGLILGNMVSIDAYGIFFKVIVILSTVFALTMARYYAPIKDEVIGEFSALVVFAALGMMFMVSSSDLLMIFLSVEFVSIAFFVLTGYIKNDPKSAEGALKYFLVGAFSAGIFVYGMSIVITSTGTTNLKAMTEILRGQGGYSPLFIAGFLLMLVGFGYKIAMVPFHTWAPEAYEGAPTPVTALLSSASKAAGFAVLLRVALAAVTGRADLVMALAVLSALTMTAGNLMALQQNNVKRLLAYSGIAHSGYILMGVVAACSGTAPALGITSVLLYAFVYMLMNIGIFAVIIAFFNKTGSDDMQSYAGFSKSNPYLALVLVVFLVSLAGIPPTAGFIGKFYVFSAIIQAGPKFLWLAIIGILNSVIALYYYFRIAYFVYFGEPKDGGKVELSTGLAVIAGVTAVLVLFVCIYPDPFISAAAGSVLNLW